MGRLGMIGNAEISVAALTRGLGHLFQRIHAIREIGVQVKDAAQVFHGDKLRQCPRACERDLIGAFAQLRRNKLEPKAS